MVSTAVLLEYEKQLTRLGVPRPDIEKGAADLISTEAAPFSSTEAKNAIYQMIAEAGKRPVRRKTHRQVA